MRVVAKEKSRNSDIKTITLRAPSPLLDELAELADKNSVSRNKLIIAILKKALNHKSFKVVIEVKSEDE